MTALIVCPDCGHENPPTAKFCGSCGATIGTAAAARQAPAPVNPAPVKKSEVPKTMFGIPAFPGSTSPGTATPDILATNPTEPTSPTKPIETSADRTLIDKPLVPDQPALPNTQKAVPKTMFGMPAMFADKAPSGPTEANTAQQQKAAEVTPMVHTSAAQPAAGLPAAQAAMGLPAAQAATGLPAAPHPADQASAHAHPPSPAPARTASAEPGGATRDLHKPAAQAPASTTEAAAAPKKKIGPSHRTMLGVAAETAAPKLQPQYTYPTGQDGLATAELATAGVRKTPWLLYAGILLAVLGIGAIGTAYWLYSKEQSVGLTARVDQSNALLVQIRDLPSGAKVMLGTQEGVRANPNATPAEFRFSLDPAALRVGDNRFTLRIERSGSDPIVRTVTIASEVFATANLGQVSSASPSYEVVILTLAGAQLTINDQAVPLDTVGRGVAVFPRSAWTNVAGGFEHRAAYLIRLPTGREIRGELRTSLRAVALRVDGVADDFVATTDHIDVWGAADPNSTIIATWQAAPGTVAAQTNATAAGTFSVRVPRPTGAAAELTIEARSEGRVPLTVERTIHLDAATARNPPAAVRSASTRSFAALLAADPDTLVDFNASVFAVSADDHSAQALMEPCDSADPCSVWIRYGEVSRLAAPANVRVVARRAGEQRYRSSSGELRTVPRFDALWIRAR